MPGRPMSHRTMWGLKDAAARRPSSAVAAIRTSLFHISICMPQRIARIVVVLDDEHPVALGKRRHVGDLCARRPASGKSGSDRTNCAPLPGPSLLATMSPLCSSAIRRASVSPTPSPPERRPGDWSCCAKSSKTCGRNSGSMPWPWSRTRERCPLRDLLDLEGDHPRLGGELGGIGDDVGQGLGQPGRIATHVKAGCRAGARRGCGRRA